MLKTLEEIADRRPLKDRIVKAAQQWAKWIDTYVEHELSDEELELYNAVEALKPASWEQALKTETASGGSDTSSDGDREG